jgi:dTDP-4-amino-4,6-dideoxygalactose transaminase
MRERHVHTVFHYIPLHSSNFGLTVGRSVGDLPLTSDVSDRLVRLPLWVGLDEQLQTVVDAVVSCLDG